LIKSTNKLLGLILSLFFVGCSPIYVTKAGYHQARLLLAREDVADILETAKDKETDNKTKTQLELSKKVLKYAKELGLNTGKRYTTYSDYKFNRRGNIT
jgi:predicted aminopeptidase